MLSRAFNMFRSFRSSDFYTDDEKESGNSDISINETSEDDSLIKDGHSVTSEVDKTNNSNICQHEFHTIQPRAAIRTKNTNLGAFDRTCTQKLGEKLVDGETYPNIEYHKETNDDSVMIIDSTPPKSKDCGNNISSKINVTKKELLCVDDEENGPLVIDLDDSVHSEEQCNRDSQSPCHLVPQEIFDLCGPEPIVYRIGDIQRPKVDEKVFNNFKVPCGVAPRKKVLTNSSTSATQSSKADTTLPSNVSNIGPSQTGEMPKTRCQLQSGQVPKITSPAIQISPAKTKNLKEGGNEKKKEKLVEDFRLRLRLPIRGTKKRRLFYLKISNLIAMVNDKYHPLHKWKDLITLKNVSELPQKDIRKLVKILKDFLEVEVVRIKSE